MYPLKNIKIAMKLQEQEKMIMNGKMAQNNVNNARLLKVTQLRLKRVRKSVVYVLAYILPRQKNQTLPCVKYVVYV